MNTLLRSLLFVPGSMPKRFEKAIASGADMVCIDLEDAVLPEDKDLARKATVNFIPSVDIPICVRINPIDTWLGQADAAALAKVNPAFIMLAKCSSVDDIQQAATVFKKNTKFIALIETLEGLDNAYAIASASDKVKALMFGGADMASQLRCEFKYLPLLFARSQLVLAAAKANVDVIDVPYIALKNEAGLLEETINVRGLGFTGKAAIHPEQIAIIHQGFTPSEQQVEYAKAVVDAVDGPDAGVVVVNGHMVDRPIIIASHRVLALANAN